MSTVEILKAAKALITDEKNWAQGCIARSASGEEVGALNPTACRFCAVGAIQKVATDESRIPVIDILRSLAKGSVSFFNDSHSHAEVLSLFDLAIAHAEGASS
jgi:hypothetical protein